MLKKKKTFDTEKWLPKAPTASDNPISQNNEIAEPIPSQSEIETVVSRIEQAQVDITDGYKNWLSIGFALAHELGETGRELFHRISRFHSEYNPKKADHQYTACLKAKGQGITIATFYQYAKDAGIDISHPRPSNPQKTKFKGIEGMRERGNATGQRNAPQQNATSQTAAAAAPIDEEDETPLPIFPDTIKQTLPKILRQVLTKSNSQQDADLLLLGAITVFSACLPNVSGIYDGRRVYANLIFLLTAKASAGKGRLTLCKNLVDPIHQHLLALTKEAWKQYRSDLAAYKQEDNPGAEPPEEPRQQMLFIPADCSATRFSQLLYENNGAGLMFETEGDTISGSFGKEHGDYSPALRKSFHHETISYTRRANKEHVEIKEPKFSVVLSGTPKQVITLIRNTENGLFSRFIFYVLNISSKWRNVFDHTTPEPLDDYFLRIGQHFYGLYQKLRSLNEENAICFSLTPQQENAFNEKFEIYHETFKTLYGEDFVASIRRLGLITFRIAMVLTTLRMLEHTRLSKEMICEDQDYQTAMSMVEVLLQHTIHVFQTFPEEEPLRRHTTTRTQRWEALLEKMPNQFTTQDFLTLAKQMNLTEKSAERHLSAYTTTGQLRRTAQGRYRKPQSPSP